MIQLVVRTIVKVSPQFFCWLAGYGSGVRVLSPETVREQYREHVMGIVQGM